MWHSMGEVAGGNLNILKNGQQNYPFIIRKVPHSRRMRLKLENAWLASKDFISFVYDNLFQLRFVGYVTITTMLVAS
jgi:hypothetical protein